MALSDRINNKFEQWRQDVTKGVAGFMVTVLGKGMELLLDIVGKAAKPALMPTIDKLLAEPDLPQETRDLLNTIKTTDGQWQAVLLAGLGGAAVGGAANAALMPPLERLKQAASGHWPFQIFDYPFVLSAWLRGVKWDADVFRDLNQRGWSQERIEAFKQLVWLRLDPQIVQQIWLRDKVGNEKFWTDLHDMGWDDDRIKVYKELAQILPSAQDLIRMAVREVFTPEIAEKYGQFQDFPPAFGQWAEKIGLTEQWAKNFWGAHWDLPSASQGFEMLHRNIISYDELKVLLRALDVMPFWRDRLIKMAYAPYTRVDIRRMYKLGILDRAGVKRTYLDLGYDEVHAENLTKFTIAYYATPTSEEEDLVDEENAKNRDLSRTDICGGYYRRMLTREEATAALAAMGYNPAQIDFYLDYEDYKRERDLKDAYVANYKDLYVAGILDDADVKSALTELGVGADEVEQLLKLWYVERIRRAQRPSRADLSYFLNKGIVTPERWKLEMAKLGYNDEYIDMYLKDQPELPSRADLTRFLTKEIITPGQWREKMARLGYSPEDIEMYYKDIISP